MAVVADRGYFKGEEILACENAGVAVTLPKPQTSGAKSKGRFTQLTGIAAPLMLANIDTDVIIRIERLTAGTARPLGTMPRGIG